MLNHAVPSDPVKLYRVAADRAIALVEAVRPDQLGSPTPCTEWTVQQLIEHLVGGTEYLLSAAQGSRANAECERDYCRFPARCRARAGSAEVPGATERTCVSPLGIEWAVSQAVAGTFMDVLIHTWDLAHATGQDEKLDPALVEACTAMFLPEMSQRGREAGIIGPAVEVGDGASLQDRLLAAMGRHP
jgi:uncharacterized protein (TIGR03086 family)